MAIFGGDIELITDPEVKAILQEVEKLFGDEMAEKRAVRDGFQKIVVLLRKF